jgi:uncharacterized protein (TIGR00369 family)
MQHDKQITIEWTSPGQWADQAKGLSGLEHMEKVRAGELPEAPILRLIGFRHSELEAGRIVFTFDPAEQHYNAIGRVHGGIASTLLDAAMGTAIYTQLPAGQAPLTVQLNVHYVRAMSATSGEMSVEGKVVSVGRTAATAEGRLVDSKGRLYAHGTTTCVIVSNEGG